MLSKVIPFEIHITVKDLPKQQEDAFVAFCSRQNAKPLMIELSRGDFIQQPMLGKIIKSDCFDEVLTHATTLSQSLKALRLLPERLKIEIPASEYALLERQNSAFKKYFEWHGKINYTAFEKLLKLCEEQKVHLSRNALKKELDQRFITLREFGSFNLFQRRVDRLSQELTQGKWKIIKQESEYCIYDNNTFLDNNWLSQ